MSESENDSSDKLYSSLNASDNDPDANDNDLSGSDNDPDTSDELENGRIEESTRSDPYIIRMETLFRQFGVQSKVQLPDLNHVELYELLQYLNRKFLLDMETEHILAWAFEVFAINSSDRIITVNDFESRFSQIYLRILRIIDLFNDEGILRYIHPSFPDIGVPSSFLAKILKVIVYMRECIIGAITINAVKRNSSSVPTSIECNLMRFSPADYSRLNEFQSLIIYLLKQIRINGYVRQEEYLYREIMIAPHDQPNNIYGTRAYERKFTISEFVYSAVQKEINMTQWENLTSNPSNQRNAVDYLKKCVDYELPPYNPHRHLHAFDNGIYVTRTNQFIPYGQLENLPPQYATFHCCNFKAIPFHSDKWIDELTSVDHYHEIQTPHFDRLMKYQEWPEEVQDWFFAMGGKMLYEINELDKWQVIPFLRGVAQTGKSTIIKHIANFFHPDYVAVLGNEMEKQFGLSILAEEFKNMLYYCTEVRENFTLPQAQFQSIVTGEAINMSLKYKTARTMIVKCPGILGGNTHMQYLDTSRSVARRIIEFYSGKCVTELDTSLDEKLREEAAAFLIKCNLAYQSKVRKHGLKSIWEVLPQYFIELRKLLEQDLNPMCSFLENSCEIEIKPGSYMPYKEFKKIYEEWCGSMNLQNAKKMKLSNDYIKILFDGKSLRLVTDTKMWCGSPLKTEYVEGVGIPQQPEDQSSSMGFGSVNGFGQTQSFVNQGTGFIQNHESSMLIQRNIRDLGNNSISIDSA